MNTAASVRLLMIENNPAVTESIHNGLTDSSQPAFSLEVAETMEQGLASLTDKPFDAILVNHHLAGTVASGGLELILAYAQAPVVVMAATQDETAALAAIRMGAQDVIADADSNCEHVRRVVLYAIERHRRQRGLSQQLADQVQARQREKEHLKEICMASPTPVSSHSFGAVPLCESAADVFGEIVAKYADALEQALVARAYQKEKSISRTLQEFAVNLGYLRASPRDVIDIHTAALKHKVQGATSAKTQAYTEEARLMLLEMMGHLAGYYRTYSYGSALFDIK
jgi:response regulator RpfG family c-di-GMP phosphodiesterase